MSLTRFSRGVRNLGGFAGGTSRLARPPQRLPEPDRRPRREVACFTAVENGQGIYGGDSGDFLGWTSAANEGCVILDATPEIFIDGTQGGYAVTVHVVYDSPSFPVEWQIMVRDSDAFPEVVVETHTFTDSTGDFTFSTTVNPGAGDWWIMIGLTGNGSQFVEVESADVTVCCDSAAEGFLILEASDNSFFGGADPQSIIWDETTLSVTGTPGITYDDDISLTFLQVTENLTVHPDGTDVVTGTIWGYVDIDWDLTAAAGVATADIVIYSDAFTEIARFTDTNTATNTVAVFIDEPVSIPAGGLVDIELAFSSGATRTVSAFLELGWTVP